MIFNHWITTEQDAYFALLDWGNTPELAKTKSRQEIAEMQKVVDILSDKKGVYWERFIKEGWNEVFEVNN